MVKLFVDIVHHTFANAATGWKEGFGGNLNKLGIMALGPLRALFSEVGTMVKLQELPPCVTFYSEDDFSYLTMEGYVQGLLDQGQQVAYITSDRSDPLLAKASSNFLVLSLKTLGNVSLTKCKAPVLVMTMPDLGSLHVARPAPTTRCVYVFHALVSIHRAYREDAFDHYDDFFCAGDYHVAELRRRFELLGRPCPRLHEVGYYKLDRIHRQHLAYQKQWTEGPTVLMAPSWHPDNLFECRGLEMIEKLLAADVRVIARPHPAFFTSLYPKAREVESAVEARLKPHPNFVWDTTMRSERSFHEADLLITDWSGSAFEYAFGTERPVLLVNTPAKVRNENWRSLGIAPFEVENRDKIGRVLEPEETGKIATVVQELLGESEKWREALISLRDSRIFNFGHSAEVGTRVLREILVGAV